MKKQVICWDTEEVETEEELFKVGDIVGNRYDSRLGQVVVIDYENSRRNAAPCAFVVYPGRVSAEFYYISSLRKIQ